MSGGGGEKMWTGERGYIKHWDGVFWIGAWFLGGMTRFFFRRGVMTFRMGHILDGGTGRQDGR